MEEPTKPPNSPCANSSDLVPSIRQFDGPSRSLRVLVADDHEMVRIGLCTMLQSRQIEVCAQAKNGQEAVEQSRHSSPDLIILDISMPVLGGIEAAQQIRFFFQTCQICSFQRTILPNSLP
jgi:CheY-like chemotaxis protein